MNLQCEMLQCVLQCELVRIKANSAKEGYLVNIKKCKITECRIVYIADLLLEVVYAKCTLL